MHNRLRALYGRAMTHCRAWDLNLAERWAARHWLADPGDYFWLTMEEVERGLMAEAEVGPTLPALVRARRETYQTYTAIEMPYLLREADVVGIVGTTLSSVLSGLPISPGQVQGHIIVLHRPEDSDRMQEGAILVTPSTDPAWFPVFLRARGLIVEMGGLLSHGSIIAREFRLPAVANIPQATSRFHDGDLVLLDGGTGLVQILESAASASSSPLTPAD
jgi:pyruvate,water dikinase